jgi:hypothetical protein
MSKLRVVVDELGVWDAAKGGRRIAALSRDALVEREADNTEDGTVRVLVRGWIFDPAAVEDGDNGGQVKELSNGRFSIDRRRSYVDSILNDPEKMNFLRPSRQSWDGSRWMHGFSIDGPASSPWQPIGASRRTTAAW